MKRIFLFILLLSALYAFAEDGRVKQSPAKPTTNDIISITYCPENKESTIKKPSKMVVEIVFWKAIEDYTFKQIPMLKDGENFTANVSIPNDSIVFITYKFSSETTVDDNNFHWWETYLYNEKGVELQGGHYQKALSSLFSYDLARQMATADAMKELRREAELYPDNIYAQQTLWLNDIKLSQENKEVISDIQKKLRIAYEKWKNDEQATHYIAYAADYAQMKDLTNLIADYYLIKNPKGKVVRLIRYNEIMNEKNEIMKTSLINSFLSDFPNADEATKDILKASLYDVFLKKQDNPSIRKFLSNYTFSDANYYINVGEVELNNGNNLKELAGFFDSALEQLKASTPSSKPAYMSEMTFLRNTDFKIGVISAMRGRIFFESKDTLKALPYLDVYYKNVHGDRNDYNSLYVECLAKAGRYDDVIRVSSEIIRADKFMPGVEKYYGEAYEKTKGSKSGFDQKLKDDMDQRRKTQKANLTSRKINKLAPDFALTDLEGKTVKLADLKGKIVIIDFWAIWCGPCRTSLPYFQQAYEKYKNNKDIKFFAINTWERVKENEKVKSIKSFLNSNNFSFPVLIDDSISKFVEKLGVESIPTKFAIDKEGNVQFTTVGFNGADEMLDEIDLWIEILLGKK